MRIEQLEYLVEVAKTHSISLASENLFVSQPAISEALKKLENELGITLLSRSKTGSYLTEVGKEVLDQAEKTIGEARKIEKIVQRYQEKSSQTLAGQLSIYTVPSFSINILPIMLPRFRQDYPLVNLSILEKNGPDILPILTKGTCDLGIVAMVNDEMGKSGLPEAIEITLLVTEKFYLRVSKHSQWAHKKSISLKEMGELPLVAFAYSEEDNILISALFKNLPPPNIVLRTSNRELMRQHVCEGHSGSILLNSSLKGASLALDDTVAIPVSDQVKLKIYGAYYKDSPKRALIDAFIGALKDYV